MAKKNGKANSVLSIPVRFAGLNVGQLTCKIGISFDRNVIPDLNEVEKVFCNHRLSGKLQLGLRDEAPTQGKLIEDCDFEIEGSFDSKNLTVSSSTIKIGATFMAADLDFNEFKKFPKGSGRLIVEQVTEIPANAPKHDDDEDDEDKHVPGSLTVDGDPKRTLMSKIFKGKILKALEGAGINDVERLGNYTESGKKLGDIDGIGPGNAVVIGETMVNYFADNRPQGFEIHNKKK